MKRNSFPLRLLPVVSLLVFWPEFAYAESSFADYQAQGWLAVFAAAFGFGFLTSLTPCVYPMIPIIVGVFGARDANTTRREAMILGTLFVLGMCVLYSSLGVIFALIGKTTGFGSLLGSPKVVIPLVIFYGLLSASLFGAFELQLPSSWQARLSKVGGKGYSGAFGLGLVAGLTAAPCTGPFLLGMLGFVGATAAGGDTAFAATIGFSLLFVYALGLGILFWVLAVFSISLPKSGRWMESVKSGGAIALLGACAYFLRPIITPLRELGGHTIGHLTIWVALIIVGIAIGAIHLSFHGRWPVKLRKAIGVIVTVAGFAGAIGWILTPSKAIPWMTDEAAAFAKAKAEGKGVMVDFSAKWCTPCLELELTFGKLPVHDAIMANFVPLKFDVTEGTDADDALQERYKVGHLPAVLLLEVDSVDLATLATHHGNELARVSKFLEPEPFMEILKAAIQKKNRQAFAPTFHRLRTPPSLPRSPTLATSSSIPTETSSTLPWRFDEDKAFSEAVTQSKGVMIDFSAKWCSPCLELDKTINTTTIRETINANFIPVKYDVSEGTEQDQERQQRHKVSQLPAIIFFNADRSERGRITKALDPPVFLKQLTKLLASAEKGKSR